MQLNRIKFIASIHFTALRADRFFSHLNYNLITLYYHSCIHYVENVMLYYDTNSYLMSSSTIIFSLTCVIFFYFLFSIFFFNKYHQCNNTPTFFFSLSFSLHRFSPKIFCVRFSLLPFDEWVNQTLQILSEAKINYVINFASSLCNR